MGPASRLLTAALSLKADSPGTWPPRRIRGVAGRCWASPDGIWLRRWWLTVAECGLAPGGVGSWFGSLDLAPWSGSLLLGRQPELAALAVGQRPERAPVPFCDELIERWVLPDPDGIVIGSRQQQPPVR